MMLTPFLADLSSVAQRYIAIPLAGKRNTKGGDTGFWKAVESALFELSQQNGSDQKANAWAV